MTDLHFIRAFEDDRVNIIPANKHTAETILNMPTHEVFTLTLEPKKRTSAQNNAIHVYCRELGQALNDAGYDMKKVLRPEVSIPWALESVKQYLWKPIQKVVTGNESTTKLTTAEVNEVYEVLSKHMAEKFGISLDFPHRGP